MEDIFLGIDGGGTGTVAVAVDRQLRLLARAEFGPGNIRLLTEQSLQELFGEIAGMGFSPAAVGIGMAGLRNEAEKRLVQKVGEATWGTAPLVITHDLEIALAAADKPTNPAA